MVIALLDQQNECNFSIRFDDESKKEMVKEFMRAGLSAWYEAAHDDIEENRYFTADEIAGFYDAGYGEPTLVLLKRYHVKADLIDCEYDEDDCVVNADEVIFY